MPASTARSVDIQDAWLTRSAQTLSLIVGACNAELEVDVDESDTLVVIAVTTKSEDTGDLCAQGVAVTLDDSIGGRRLVDAHDDEELEPRPAD